ncbi:MAG: DUF362 domain-containing protein [Ruthenibacterium sp.]
MNTVFCCAVPSYDDALILNAFTRILDSSAAAKTLCAASHVLLKPNLLAKHVPAHAVTTHPAVLRGAILALQARGVTHITVADSSGGLYNATAMNAIYKQSGLAAVCAETGATLYLDCAYATRQTDGKRVRSFNLLQPVLEADFILNLPKFKTHVMTGMTGAVKNLFGTVPGLQKAEFHMRFPEKEAFGEMLVDLCECVRPQLTVIDGIVGMEGDGPAGGAPREIGVLLGGENPYTLDLALCRMMGLDAMTVPFLSAAHARNLCDSSLDLSLLAGDVAAAAPLADFKLPESYAAINFSARAPRALRWAVPPVEKLLAPRPHITKSACVGCGKCAEICPGHAIVLQNKVAQIQPKSCIRCFCCHEMCPAKAIKVRRFGIFNW